MPAIIDKRYSTDHRLAILESRLTRTPNMTESATTPFVVAALYQFARIDTPEALRNSLLERMTNHNIRGTLLVAPEGINGTIAGTRTSIDALIDWLKTDHCFEDMSYKESFSDEMPFARTKVKLKNEIVTMGVEGIDPNRVVGTYVEPQDWNALIRDPDVVVVDTRNDYEVEVGTFNRSINPAISTFREFPAFVDARLDPARTPKVAMFCTGGIRCEKSTAYLKERGFKDVYHLHGGILKYLEEVPEADSEWTGECFVFDERVTVDHALHRGRYDQCHACRRPITEADKNSAHYVPGVSCPHCHDETTVTQRERFEEREKQIRLAAERHEPHIGAGSDISAVRKQRRTRKLNEKNRQRT
jgi:UPF0176 protein